MLAAFAVALLADLASLLLDLRAGHLVAKPLLMPLLAGYAVARRAPRALVAALLFGWGGDVLLLSDADWAFLAGMASFAAGHVCYLLLFGRARSSAPLALVYLIALAGTVTLLWPGLPADLRIPVAGYATLLTAMAYRASSAGAVAGAGGFLFLLSDTLIAGGVADWPRPPVPDFWVMLTYGLAQFLLAAGTLGHAGARTRAYGESRGGTRTPV
ncbi:lysoplasmalogenase [Streptomyces sp. NPDC001941]|uniref:lysoplasmalogenase n=1 Tax=Streptomyces sp. NPDC001941 TaxID=3154659 RepID=UPI003316EDD2